jgi:transglutaminase-like putative cysteine protease
VLSNLPPDFGPGQYYLHFTVSPRQAGGFSLADPVRLSAGGRVPILVPAQNLQQVLYFDQIDAVIPNVFVDGPEYRYTQVMPPPGLSDNRRPAENFRVHFETLVNQYPPGLARWTLELLRRLAADPDYGLEGLEVPPANQLPGQRLNPQTRDWERIARALERYLARSGEYTYSLDLLHQDTSLDPVLDFLLNVRQGHCECYATALALMLRSQGIPAQVVKGYRGAEGQGDGSYVVRNRDAHSWVEVMVESLPPEQRLDWLTLDPTPETEAPPAPSFSLFRWLQDRFRDGGEVWKAMVLDYDAEQQANVWDSVTTARGLAVLAAGALTLTAVALAVLLGFPLLRRRRKRFATAASFYGRMVALLTRHARLEPQPAQTPREYGEEAGRLLRGRPAAAALADLPARLAELFYRVRFGGRPLSQLEAHAVESELDQLAAALRR